jgi:hypothetical protein
MLALNPGDSVERIAAFLDQHPAPGLPMLLDIDKVTPGPWHVRGIPVAMRSTAPASCGSAYWASATGSRR